MWCLGVWGVELNNGEAGRCSYVEKESDSEEL
jgi:hypothetical protein